MRKTAQKNHKLNKCFKPLSLEWFVSRQKLSDTQLHFTDEEIEVQRLTCWGLAAIKWWVGIKTQAVLKKKNQKNHTGSPAPEAKLY